jgi:multiple sugar transport system permease protein
MKKWGFCYGYIKMKKLKKWFRKDSAVAWIFLAPSGIGFALFYLIPFAMGVFYSFMDSTVDSHFVGLDNYRELLESGSFRKAASNTFYFSVVSVPLMLVLSLGLAMLLNKNIYLLKWLRTAYVLPLVVQFKQLISTADNFADVDGAVISIIGDESRAFFSGQKSVEEVAKLIQNKTTTFLNE